MECVASPELALHFHAPPASYLCTKWLFIQEICVKVTYNIREGLEYTPLSPRK